MPMKATFGPANIHNHGMHQVRGMFVQTYSTPTFAPTNCLLNEKSNVLRGNDLVIKFFAEELFDTIYDKFHLLIAEFFVAWQTQTFT